MTYKLLFIPSSEKEWRKLPSVIAGQFKKKLKERLDHPHVDKDRLRGLPCCYKIKLRTVGYRLVYEVVDGALIVKVIAVGKRDKMGVYLKAVERLK